MKLSIRAFFGVRASIGHSFRETPTLSPHQVAHELDRFFIAGFQYHQGPALIEELREVDELNLVREANNGHDRRAVALRYGEAHFGYVPRERNQTLSRLLDQCAPLQCRITHVDPDANPWQAVKLAVSILSLEPSATVTTNKKTTALADL
jgi:hypothetical protein